MRALLLIAAALLAGCASRQQIHAPAVVKVPVTVPCLQDVPMEPDFATDAQLLAGSGYQTVIGLRKDRAQRQDYEQQLRASIAGCR